MSFSKSGSGSVLIQEVELNYRTENSRIKYELMNSFIRRLTAKNKRVIKIHEPAYPAREAGNGGKDVIPVKTF